MKSTLLLMGFAFLSLLSYSQSVELQTIGSTGEEITSPAGSVAFTLGEPVSETLESPENQLTQGFHQGYITFVSVEKIADIDFNTVIYPNPAIESTTLEISGIDYTGFTYVLYDLSGKQLKSGTFQNNREQLDLNGLSQSMYLLKIENLTRKISETYRLQKI
jgi:hypothetical protein